MRPSDLRVFFLIDSSSASSSCGHDGMRHAPLSARTAGRRAERRAAATACVSPSARAEARGTHHEIHVLVEADNLALYPQVGVLKEPDLDPRLLRARGRRTHIFFPRVSGEAALRASERRRSVRGREADVLQEAEDEILRGRQETQTRTRTHTRGRTLGRTSDPLGTR